MNETYQPIDCSLHDQYEIAVLHKTPLHLRWKEENGGITEDNVLPVDVITAKGEEFLVIKRGHSHRIGKIRLDRIIKMY